MRVNIVLDCEASGPCPGYGDLLCFGAVVVESGLKRTFRSPLMVAASDRYDPAAYAAIGSTREEHARRATVALETAMATFGTWLEELHANRLILWSDNPAFDGQWIGYGFAAIGRRNPFGHSARRIGDLYAGLSGNAGNTQGWKKRRRTPHDHDPLNDAIGNAEALLSVLAQYDQLKAVGITNRNET